MKKQLAGVIHLTRYREYIFFVIVTTLIGAATGGGTFGWRLLGVLVANWLAVGFAFMINDVEDAPDDALNPAKAQRNPVSAGELPPTLGRIASFAVAILAGIVYWFLGPWPFLTGLTCLVLAHLYSWRAVRLKVRPGLDLVSHALMLAGLQFLAGYLAFAQDIDSRWIWPFIFVVAVSLYGQLYNEMRDMEGDLRAGLRHSATVLGRRITNWAMWALLALGLIAAVITIAVIGLIPTWVLIVMAVLEIVFVLPAAWNVRRVRNAMDFQQPFHTPAQYAAVIAMLIWFLGPWVNGLLRVWGWKLF